MSTELAPALSGIAAHANPRGELIRPEVPGENLNLSSTSARYLSHAVGYFMPWMPQPLEERLLPADFSLGATNVKS